MSLDWNQTARFLQEQGPVFWAAAAAVAAGIALLAGAAWLQLRRLRRRASTRARAPRVRLTESGYTANAPLPASVAPLAPAPTPDPRLDELRDRLAAAAARLETVRAARNSVSGLKTSPKRVEYVHRSGHA